MSILHYHQLNSISELENLRCGIDRMDHFILNGLENSLIEHKCTSYVVRDEDEVVAFFALCDDQLILDEDYKDDMRDGYADTPKPIFHGDDEKNVYLTSNVFPVIDIAYLVVDEKRQHDGIGTAIMNQIFCMARAKEPHVMFLTVDALFLKDYSAVEFYRKFGFQQMYPPYECEYNKNVQYSL